MSDKITITKKQFERWADMHGIFMSNRENFWQSLITESQRRELVEVWAVVSDSGLLFIHPEKDKAEETAKASGSRVVTLREVIE
jgi:hypothetical protein